MSEDHIIDLTTLQRSFISPYRGIFENPTTGDWSSDEEAASLKARVAYEESQQEYFKSLAKNSVFKKPENGLIDGLNKIQWEEKLASLLMPIAPANRQEIPAIVGWLINQPNQLVLQQGNSPSFIEASKREFNSEEWEYAPVRWPIFFCYKNLNQELTQYNSNRHDYFGPFTVLPVNWEGIDLIIPSLRINFDQNQILNLISAISKSNYLNKKFVLDILNEIANSDKNFDSDVCYKMTAKNALELKNCLLDIKNSGCEQDELNAVIQQLKKYVPYETLLPNFSNYIITSSTSS